MSGQTTEIADFYQQLALLVKADLPLPDSIQQLGKNCQKRKFQAVLEQVSADTAKGESLNEALSRHPDLFEPFHIQLIETGEKSGALSEILFEVALFARANQKLISRAREAMTYPVFTILFTVTIFSLLLRFVVPEFQVLIHEILWPPRSIPLLTRLVFFLSTITVAIGPLLYILLVGMLAFFCWLFSGILKSDALFYRAMSICPGARQVLREADLARVTGLLSSYLRRGVPIGDALSQTAELAQGSRFCSQLRAWSERTQQGETFRDILGKDGSGADGLLALTVCHSAENELAEELRALSLLYVERAEAARSRAVALWQFIMVFVMTTVAGLTIFALFSPLLTLIEQLG